MSPAVQPSPKTASFPLKLALLVGALVTLCYAPAIASLFHDWMTNEDVGHGFFVPLVAGYIVWQERHELARIPARANWWGLGLVLLGAAQSLVATLGVEMFLSRSALVLTIAGAIWTVGGTGWLKKLAFPIFLLAFMVPLPAVIYNSITFPLQLLASQFAAWTLDVLNIPVLRNGNVLELPSGKLSVVDACSGIRSLLSLTFLSLVYGYFFEKSTRVRAILFAATVPIAIFTNASRVTITGLLAQVKPELAEGVFHESTGWVVFMLALFFLILLHQAIMRSAKWLERRRAHTV